MLLEEYGLIGDTESAALMGRNGAIDWPGTLVLETEFETAEGAGRHPGVLEQQAFRPQSVVVAAPNLAGASDA
jgi:hypothetical protein